MPFSKRRNATFAALTAMLLAACGSDDEPNPGPGPGPGPDPDPDPTQVVSEVIALTASGRLVSFQRETPGTLTSNVAVTGLASGETLVGIDYRPVDAQLYGLTSGGRLVTVAPDTGAITVKSTLMADASDTTEPFTALSGTDFAVDFNPAADRLRMVSDTGQNLRINVDTGGTITDGAIHGGNDGAQVTGAAYTNSFPETVNTRLFVLDAATDTVYLQDPPNDGTLSSPAALGVDATAVNGYDIDARTNVGYAALTVGGTPRLYRIDPTNTTAAATELAVIGGGEPLKGLAMKQATGIEVVGLTADHQLVRAAASAPNTLLSSVPVTGLPEGETLLGIDQRPADRQLYALSSAGKLYTVDASTGVATAKSTLAADASDTTEPFTALAGAHFVIDFNPVADRLRVVSDTGQNLRINVDTGATTTDGVIHRDSGDAAVPFLAPMSSRASFCMCPPL